MNLEKSSQSFKQKILLYGYTEIILSVNELLKISFNYFDIIVCISHNDNK